MAEDNYGYNLLGVVWDMAIQELLETMMTSDSTENRILAADTLLKYISSMNNGLGDPFVPPTKPEPIEDPDSE